MRRLLFTLSVTVLLLTGCDKSNLPGDYNPDCKIAKMYTSRTETGVEASPNVPKYLSELWTWDNDQLKQITYYDYCSTDNTNIEQYTYNEDGHLSRITDNTGRYSQFDYQNGKLSTMEFRYGTNHELIYKVEFSYDGKRVDQYTITQYPATMINKGTDPLSHTLALFMPQPLSKTIDKALKRHPAPKTIDTTERVVKLTWNNNNVTAFNITYDEYPSNPENYFVTYDNKCSPYKNRYTLFYAISNSYSTFSCNNVTSVVERGDDGQNYTLISSTYKYSGDYPIECTSTYNTLYWTTIEQTDYFEYQ